MVFFSGWTEIAYAPPVAVCTVVSFCAAVAPHDSARTSTLSPALAVDTVPVPATFAPKISSSGFAANVSESGGAVTVIDPRNVFPFVFGSEYEYEPATAKAQFALVAGCSTTGLGVHVKPVVDLKLI